jgi:glycine betaine/proline transport system substrate-binding protein
MTNPSPTIRLATVNLGFYRVVAAVVADLLHSRGYRTQIDQAPHEELYPRVGAGEFHLFTAAWLPSAHAPLWRKHGRDLERLAPLYDGAHFFLAVGQDTLPAAQCIDDLGRFAQHFDPVLQALTPRAGLTRLTRSTVKAYSLDSAGFAVATGTAVEWRGAIDRALAGEPVVLALWTPLFTDLLPIRPLADPLHSFGRPDTAYLVAHASAHMALDPETMAMLRNLRINRETVSAMDLQVTFEGATPDEAARSWQPPF